MTKLKLKNGDLFEIQPELIQVYKRAYPLVDIDKQLAIMAAWCISNPSKRKTKRGILRFVNNWLSNQTPELSGAYDTQSTSYRPPEQTENTTTENRINQLKRARI